MGMLTDIRYALRSLARARGLAITVILTLALGIGANAAIFSVVRGVLLTPLVNDNEESLVYIRQSAPGRGTENANFSVPEINDLKAGLKSITQLGDFSTLDFTLTGLGEPRVVRAGVVSGSFFPVMGLQPIRGRLIDATDDGGSAPSVTVLTHRFWTESLNGDESLIGKQIKLGDRASTIIGVLEPSVPYPSETQLIANVVTSSHHMSATMQDGRVHRMTELFGRLAPSTSVEQAVAELRTIHGGMVSKYREAYPERDDFRINAVPLRDQIT
ncbi:MAG TPA: ABC transporter permease, partial [Vicinamibacterales bacterium]|nr:ABC transporter permease [Vicinamibacterales bacterium]